MSTTGGTQARSLREEFRFRRPGPLLRHSLIFSCAAAMVAGCRSQPYVNAHIESVNAEYRQLEDYVYALEEENARLQQQLDAVRAIGQGGASSGATVVPSRGGGLLRRSPAPARRSTESESLPGLDIQVPDSTSPAPGGRSTTQRPATSSPESAAPADTPPTIEFAPRQLRQPGAPGEDALPPPTAPQGGVPPARETIPALPTDKKITHLFLNPLQTGGANFDAQPGDDGLRLLIEPRNAAGQFVREAGALSIVLLDPAGLGEAARVARWDFDQAAMRQLLAESSPGHGIQVEMPWPATAPDATRLKLFVRYETPDGRRLQADREIFLAPAGQTASRWTPRSADRPRTAGLATAVQTDSAETIRSASSADGPARPTWSPNR